MMTPTRLPANTSLFFRIVASGTALRGLHDDLHALPGQVHGIDDLLFFAGQKYVGDMVGDEMPGEILERHLQPVGHGLRRIIGDDVAGLERAVGVIGLFLGSAA